VVSWKPRAFIYHNFLSDAEAEHIKKLAAPTVSTSKCGSSTSMSGSSTSKCGSSSSNAHGTRSRLVWPKQQH
jgi:prolyl 4-hydroxylase